MGQNDRMAPPHVESIPLKSLDLLGVLGAVKLTGS